MTDTDRTIHATSVEGKVELVRYDREGRWYAEMIGFPETGEPRRARLRTVGEAVRLALHWEASGGEIFLGRSGGGRFDSMVVAGRQKAERQKVKAR